MSAPYNDLLSQARLLHTQLQREIGTSSISLFDYLRGYYAGSLTDLANAFSTLNGKRELVKTLEHLFPELLLPTPPACPAACFSRVEKPEEPFIAYTPADILKAEALTDYSQPIQLPTLPLFKNIEVESEKYPPVEATPENEWLHVHQIAEQMGVSHNTIYNYASTGRIQRKKEGTVTLYRLAA